MAEFLQQQPSYSPYRHLIISGGGPIGFRFIGVFQQLCETGRLCPEQLESIYATSVGGIIAVLICLLALDARLSVGNNTEGVNDQSTFPAPPPPQRNLTWNIIADYFVERPWQNLFQLTGKQFISAYQQKGLYNRTIPESIFCPLFSLLDLHVRTMTLREFYIATGISLHLFSFDLNRFETVELTQAVYPNMLLMDAVCMSCALPGVVEPTILHDVIYMPVPTTAQGAQDNEKEPQLAQEIVRCMIDGGVMCNFPVQACLQNHLAKEGDQAAILGVTIHSEPEQSNITVTEESTIFDFLVAFSSNSMCYITHCNAQQPLDNCIRCVVNENVLALDIILRLLHNEEERRKWIDAGKKDALRFLGLSGLNV